MNKACFLIVLLAGCTTIPEVSQTPAERAIRDFEFKGLRMGSTPASLVQFPQVRQLPSPNSNTVDYEIFNPSPQVSIAKASFYRGALCRLELRYFDGPGARTLTRAGGWVGIREYLIEKYGPPSKFGPDVPVETTQAGVSGRYAKFNGVWIFSRVKRQLNYVALSDGKGGVGVVTISDTTPIPASPAPSAPPPPPAKPNPPPIPRANPGF